MLSVGVEAAFQETELGLVLSEERVNERRREIEVNRERVRENMRERHAVGWYSWESLQLLQYLELSWGQIPHGNERKPAEVERAFWRNVSLQMENVCSCSPSFNVVCIYGIPSDSEQTDCSVDTWTS